MRFPFMDLRRSSKIEVDTNLPWPKSFSISHKVRFCHENTYFEQNKYFSKIDECVCQSALKKK